MEEKKIFLPQGELNVSQLKEIITKMNFSFFGLLGIILFFHFTSAYQHFQTEANIFTVAYFILISIRAIHLRKLNAVKDSFESTQIWKQISALALISALATGGIITAILAYPATEAMPYLGVLAVIGTLVGGSSVFYLEKDFFNMYAIANILFPTTYLLFSGTKENYILTGIVAIFYFYIRQTTHLQNKFYWKGKKDQKMMNLMIDSLPSPVSILDKELNFIKVNKTLAKYYNLSPEEYEGKPLGFFGGYDESKELIYFLSEFIKNPSRTSEEREIDIMIAGEQRCFYFVVAKIENTNNVACLSMDLSDLKSAQKELEQQKAMGIEAAKLSSIGEMANSMAHEINNPLSIILGKSEQAIRVLQKPEPKYNYLEKSLETITDNVRRIATIIQGLRTLSGESDEGMYDVQLPDIFDQVKLLSNERVLSTGVELLLSAPPKDYISANPSQIAQVILHLINNSLEAIQHQDKPWIKISFIESEGQIEINIQDSGEGIPIEISEKVFHPFFSTKELGKGMGLGLSVSRGIIDAHKGEFFIDNACKHTSFVIRLPKLFSAAA